MSFYRKPTGERIQLLNKRPRNLSRGGMIKDHPSIPRHHLDEDTIKADLEAGSLVVPVPVVKHLRHYKGPMTGPKQERRDRLVRAVVMANEYVVNRKYAPKVEAFLAKKGIRLPLGS